MTKIKKIFSVSMILVLCASFIIVGTSFAKVQSCFAMQTSAKACAVIEGKTGRILFSKNQNQKLPMASTTKIMTAITAIENCKNLDEKFVVSKK